MFELMVEDTFDSAHALRGYMGKCENMHGHTWRVQVFVRGSNLNKIGILHDFRDIKTSLSKITEELDHKNINEIGVFKDENPSSENLAKFIYKSIKKDFVGLSKVVVWESPVTCASFFEEENE